MGEPREERNGLMRFLPLRGVRLPLLLGSEAIAFWHSVTDSQLGRRACRVPWPLVSRRRCAARIARSLQDICRLIPRSLPVRARTEFKDSLSKEEPKAFEDDANGSRICCAAVFFCHWNLHIGSSLNNSISAWHTLEVFLIDSKTLLEQAQSFKKSKQNLQTKVSFQACLKQSFQTLSAHSIRSPPKQELVFERC